MEGGEKEVEVSWRIFVGTNFEERNIRWTMSKIGAIWIDHMGMAMVGVVVVSRNGFVT